MATQSKHLFINNIRVIIPRSQQAFPVERGACPKKTNVLEKHSCFCSKLIYSVGLEIKHISPVSENNDQS